MKLMSRGAIGVCIASVMFAGAGQARAAIIGLDNGTGFTVNNTGAVPPNQISNGVLTLTNNNVEAHTVFNNTPQDDRIIFASFGYQATGTGEGFAFVLQNDTRGASALGFGGGGLGYAGITPSVALEVSLNNANGIGGAGIAFAQNGVINPFIAPGSINLASGDRIVFNLFYNGTRLFATLTDIDNSTIPSFTTSTVVNIPAILGGNTAFVGFTGASAAAKSIQKISGFSYANVPEPSSIIMAMTGCVTGFGVWRHARRKAAAPLS